MASDGVIFGDYRLLGRLNRGGMAEVFLAKSTKPELDGKLLAIKRTLPDFSADPDFVSMFTDEARIAKGLKHPHICELYDQGQADKQLFLVMEFIHGKDLKVVQHRAKQRNEMMPVRFTAWTLARIAEALHFAHNKLNDQGELEGIVHRDISPQNILLSYDGQPKLIDFGIAKAKDRVAKTQVGVLKGKFAYMSPEQAMGKQIDHRTDVFALGVVLYEMVTGHSAFKGSSDFSTLQNITQAKYAPPTDFNPDLPPRLLHIIKTALAKDLEERYPTAEALAVDLDGFVLDDDRGINAGALSAYMRKLFREDYIREATRIKQYVSGELTAAPPTTTSSKTTEAGTTTGGSPHREGATQTDVDSLEVGDATGVAPSFDAERSDVGSHSGVKPKPRSSAPPPPAPAPAPAPKARSLAPHSWAPMQHTDESTNTEEVPVPSLGHLADTDEEPARREGSGSKSRPGPGKLVTKAEANAKTEIGELPVGMAATDAPKKARLGVTQLESRSEVARHKRPGSGKTPPPQRVPPPRKAKTRRSGGARRRGMLSGGEIAVLLVVAIFGAAVIALLYVYGTRQAPIALPRIVQPLQPQPQPTPPRR